MYIDAIKCILIFSNSRYRVEFANYILLHVIKHPRNCAGVFYYFLQSFDKFQQNISYWKSNIEIIELILSKVYLEIVKGEILVTYFGWAGIAFFVGLFWWMFYDGYAWLGFSIAIICTILGLIKNREDLQTNKNLSSKLLANYKDAPKRDKHIQCLSFSDTEYELGDYFIWIDNEYLYLQYNLRKILNETVLDIHIFNNYLSKLRRNKLNYKILISNIHYYSKDGQKHIFSEVSGGGSSLGGALIGGALAGGAGAVIGSRKEITSTTQVIDERKVGLYFKDENNKEQYIYFNYASYDVLKVLLFDKDLDYLNLKQEETVVAEPSSTTSLSVADELKKFKELLDAGVIDEQEFQEQKKRLLGN